MLQRQTQPQPQAQPQDQTQARPQAQPGAGPTMDPQDVSFWLGKAVEWGQAESPETQRDTCLHLSRLRHFLHTLLTHINTMGSTSETMRRLPFVGQFLGRLCWNSYVTADAETRRLLFSSVWTLYSEEPVSAVERKANQWIQNVLCQLVSGEEDSATCGLVKHLGCPLRQYHAMVLKKMVSDLMKEVGPNCRTLEHPKERCSCDIVLRASVACVPLVTCPEAAPLIGALLQRPVTCDRAALSQDFLDAVSSAYSRKCVFLEEQAVVSLWYHSLPSLEGAVVSLLESALAKAPQNLELLLSSTHLPKACAQHCSVFLIVQDIFRSMLVQVEGNQTLLSLIHTFNCCLLRELAALQPQECVPFKAFFPRAPQSLLAPLLTHSSEMPQEAWPDHLGWLSHSLQRITQEEEEEEEEEGGRRSCGVFEAWFLLVQCGHWAELAGQLLVSAGPRDCEALLWMLTFYHHPTNRGHHRALQLVAAREAWDHLRSLFLVSAPPLPPDRLKVLAELLSARPQQLSLAPLLVLSLLLNFAVFSHNPLSGAREIVRTVVDQAGLVLEAECILSSTEHRLNRGSCSSRVQLRIRALQDTLVHTDTHTHTHTHTHSDLDSELDKDMDAWRLYD